MGIGDDPYEPQTGQLTPDDGEVDDAALDSALSELAEFLREAPVVEGQWFQKQRVAIDGRTYRRCRFDHCDILVETGTFRFEECVLANCKYLFLSESGKVASLFSMGLLLAGLLPPQNFDRLPDELKPWINEAEDRVSIPKPAGK